MIGQGKWLVAAVAALALAGCGGTAAKREESEAGAPRIVLGRWWAEPGERVYLRHEGVPNGEGSLWYKLRKDGEERECSMSRGLHGKEDGLYSFTFAPEEPGGYAVELWSSGVDGTKRLQARTSLTVTRTPIDDVRLGFYSNFAVVSGDYRERARALAAVGINATEFYDYFPAHGEYAPRVKNYRLWQDMTVDDVNAKVAANRERGIWSIAYVAAYSATADWYAKFPYPMTNAAGAPLKCGPHGIKPAAEYAAKGVAADYHIMAIHEGSPWREHILDQYVKAVTDGPDDLVNFDGIEVDSYGHGGEYFAPGFAPAAGSKRPTIDDELAGLVGAAKAKFPKDRIVFSNTIGGEAAKAFAPVVDFQFMEFWPWYFKDYAAMGQRLYESRGHRNQRVVFKLYPDSMEPKAQAFAPDTLRLLMGVGLATGSSLMIAGEPDPATGELRALRGPFYPDHMALGADQRGIVEKYNLVDAQLYGYTHGAAVTNAPELATQMRGYLSWGFKNAADGAVAVSLLRVEVDRNWTTQARESGESKELAVEIPIARGEGAAPGRVLWVSPDAPEWEVTREVAWEVRGGKIHVRIPGGAMTRFGCVVVLTKAQAERLTKER